MKQLTKSYKLLIVVLLAFSLIPIAKSQEAGFKKYVNNKRKFSVQIPNSWTIKYSKVQGEDICIPITVSEKEIYSDCFEGLVFSIEYYDYGLDSVLNSSGLYTKIGDWYYTSDTEFDSVEVKRIKGKKWFGAYHNNVCGITCKETGFHAVLGECEFIYFSNSKRTILFTTHGKKLDEDTRDIILKTFEFR